MSVAVLIKKNCAEFLHETHGTGFLYRGVRFMKFVEPYSAYDAEGNEMEYIIKNVRQDRRPLDTGAERHALIDDWFQKKFGFKARSEAVFAFGEKALRSDLAFYGRPCIIFPIGPIKYAWSPIVEDMYGSMNIYSKDSDTTTRVHSDNSAVIKWLEESNYKDSGLSDAVMKDHEVMIKCSSYYAFPIEYKEQLQRALA